MNHIHKVSWQSLKTLVKGLLTEGQIAEQFVGQHLLARAPAYQNRIYIIYEKVAPQRRLIYCRKTTFLLAIVKAGAAGKIRSLHCG